MGKAVARADRLACVSDSALIQAGRAAALLWLDRVSRGPARTWHPDRVLFGVRNTEPFYVQGLSEQKLIMLQHSCLLPPNEQEQALP